MKLTLALNWLATSLPVFIASSYGAYAYIDHQSTPLNNAPNYQKTSLNKQITNQSLLLSNLSTLKNKKKNQLYKTQQSLVSLTNDLDALNTKHQEEQNNKALNIDKLDSISKELSLHESSFDLWTHKHSLSITNNKKVSNILKDQTTYSDKQTSLIKTSQLTLIDQHTKLTQLISQSETLNEELTNLRETYRQTYETFKSSKPQVKVQTEPLLDSLFQNIYKSNVALTDLNANIHICREQYNITNSLINDLTLEFANIQKQKEENLILLNSYIQEEHSSHIFKTEVQYLISKNKDLINLIDKDIELSNAKLTYFISEIDQASKQISDLNLMNEQLKQDYSKLEQQYIECKGILETLKEESAQLSNTQ